MTYGESNSYTATSQGKCRSLLLSQNYSCVGEENQPLNTSLMTGKFHDIYRPRAPDDIQPSNFLKAKQGSLDNKIMKTNTSKQTLAKR